jgi:nucleoid-associated protein YgaU
VSPDLVRDKSEFFDKFKEEGTKSPAQVRKAAACKRSVVQKPKDDEIMKKSKPAVTGVKGKPPGPPVSINTEVNFRIALG